MILQGSRPRAADSSRAGVPAADVRHAYPTLSQDSAFGLMDSSCSRRGRRVPTSAAVENRSEGVLRCEVVQVVCGSGQTDPGDRTLSRMIAIGSGGVVRMMLTDGVCVQAEWDQLAVVAMVRPEFFTLTEPINHTQRRFYGTANHPSTRSIIKQHDRILNLFVAQGIRVVEISPTSSSPFQFNVRDAAVVIGSRLVLSRMARVVRSREPDLLAAALGLQSALTIPTGRLEGGDVIVTPSEVFVGLSDRTDEAGYASLSGLVTENRTVTPIRLKSSTLHLDIALNLLGRHLGLIHRPSIIGDLPPSLGDVEWIEVTDEEFAEQAVNVLVLDPDTVMLDARHERLRATLETKGLRCIPVKLDEITKAGGGIRCMTLPLARIHTSELDNSLNPLHRLLDLGTAGRFR